MRGEWIRHVRHRQEAQKCNLAINSTGMLYQPRAFSYGRKSRFVTKVTAAGREVHENHSIVAERSADERWRV
jgi:hypothetical protein